MSDVQPIPAIRYATTASRDLGSRIAPPYDVLDAADKRALLDADARNFVLIDLPQVPAKDAGPPEIYDRAARQLRDWLTDGTMVRDREPAIYVYHQRYEANGRTWLRRKFFARLRLEPFGQGSVFPHEKTFGGPKEDRLMLTKATRANLSPIFGLYPDPQNTVADRLAGFAKDEPLAHGTLDGVEGRLWAVRDPRVIADVAHLMRDKAIYIADGHHRYGTSLLYRDWLASQQGGIAVDHPANFVLCVFCAMEDPGLLILPTHRVLVGAPVDPAVLAKDPEIEVKPLGGTPRPADIPAALAQYGPQAVALFDAGAATYQMVRPRRAELLDALEPSHSVAWRRLALAFLHSYVIDRVLAPRLPAAPTIHYVKAADAAVSEARETRGSVFLLQPSTMQEMRDVCQAGDLMPQKSTFFFPKLASGLIINPLE